MDFRYKVADRIGKIHLGTISASTYEEARRLLKEKGYVILDLEIQETLPSRRFFFSQKISGETLYSFFRELSILLKAGITLDKALETIIKSHRSEALKDVLTKILKSLREGKSVTTSFEPHGIFTTFMLNMIKSGEAIGSLQQAFSNIADYLKFQMKLKKEIKSALIYPLFLIFSSFLTLIIIFKFILPKFFTLFGTSALPLPAKILLSFSHIFTFKAFLVALAISIVFYLVSQTSLIYYLKTLLLQLFYKAPFLGVMLRSLDLARFTYSMHSMLKGGLDFIDALTMSKNIFLLPEYRAFIDRAIIDIRQGKSIAEAFSGVTFPELFQHMLKVGEETASLKEIFLELNNIYEENFMNSVKNFLSLLEPIVIAVTGIIVGVIVISLILTVMGAGVIKF